MDVLDGGGARRPRPSSPRPTTCGSAAQHFHQAALINGRLVALRAVRPRTRSSALLEETYGGHVLVLPGDGERPRPRRRPSPR